MTDAMTRTLLACVLCVGLIACSGDDGDAGMAGDDPSGDGTGDGAAGDGSGSGGDDAASGSGDGGDPASSGDSGPQGGTGDDEDQDGDPNAPGMMSPGVIGGFIPMFPGAGTSGAGQPLMNGGLCDYVEGDPIPNVGDVTRCFFGPEDDMNPAATIEQVLECQEGVDVLRVRLTFDPAFVDNTYGEQGSVGWDGEKKGFREFGKLVGSDHAEILILDSNGETAAHFAIDYISEDETAPSGYASLGVDGGDGEMIEGDRSIIVDTATSIDRNLNERGYGDYIEDSPVTDEAYTPNPDTPEWDYRVVFEAWIDLEAFGDAEFGGAFIEFVHASPAKGDENTIEVIPGECPPSWDPPGDDPPDDDMPPGEGEVCQDGDPDTDCGGGELPPSDPEDYPAFCERFPTDPACRVD